MKTFQKIPVMMLFLVLAVTIYSDSSAEYVFPDDTEIANMLNVSVSEFHREIKKGIISDFPNEVRKTGSSNPDIGYEKSSKHIAFKNKSTGKVVETNESILGYAR